jgi:tagatose-6-phosphate ketose/aldose isomerase
MPDDVLVLSDDGTKLSEALLAVCFILPAQLLGYFSSLKCGLNPDRPSASGAISRVVEGVIIYPYPSV